MSRSAVVHSQTVWSFDGHSVIYRDIELEMDQLFRLVRYKYEYIYTLLHDKLLFRGIVRITAAADVDIDIGATGRFILSLVASQLRDSFDVVDYRAFWFICPANVELLAGADTVLFIWIRYDCDFAAMFITRLVNDGGFVAILP